MNNTSRRMIAIIMAGVIAISLISGVLYYYDIFESAPKNQNEGGTGNMGNEEEEIVRYFLEHDTKKKTISYSGNNYTVSVGYDKKAVITVLRDHKTNILDEMRGIHTGYQIRSGKGYKSYNSLALDQDPLVQVDEMNKVIVMQYADQYTDNTVTITFRDDNFTLDYKRTILHKVDFVDQSFPSINLAQNVAESIRFPKSGSNLHVGGRASAQKNYLAAGTGYRASYESEIFLGNIRCAKHEIGFSVLAPKTEKSEEIAVAFHGELKGTSLMEDAATQVQRVPENQKLPLELATIVGKGSALRCPSNPLGWGKYDGRTVLQGENVYTKVSFEKGDVTELSYTVEVQQRDPYYDLGTLNGVDEAVLAEILHDYSRTMIMDWDMGTAVENSQMFYELPALEQHWNTNLIGILQDDQALCSQMNGLLNIPRLQAKDGHIMSPYPQSVVDGWGWNYSDMMPGYTIAVIDAYILSGDRDFLDTLRDSVRQALAAQKAMYIKDDVYLCVNLATSEKLNANDYWEHNSGKYNGYTTPMYYQALVRWAEIERTVYKEDTVAAEYEALAARIRYDYNRLMWSEETGTFLYGSDSEDVVYLPVQAAALSSGIAWEGRNARIIEAVERDTAVFDLGYHVMNIRDLQDAKLPANQSNDHTKSMTGMNGGWYGAPDGEFYLAFPQYGDRTLIEKYIDGLVKQYNITGFINATCYKRDGVTPGDYGWWDMMQTMAYPIYGLYRYGYGFAPSLNGLMIEPFISENMIGSCVQYRWRGQDMTVTYNGLYDFDVDIESLPTDIFIRFINQKTGHSYEVEVNGIIERVQADELGVVSVKLTNAGKNCVKLLRPEKENVATKGELLSAGKPVATSSTYRIDMSSDYWSDCLTDTSYNRYWRTAKNNMSQEWIRVALGRKYKVGKFKLYTNNSISISYVIEGTNDPSFEQWTVLADVDKKVTVSEKQPLEVNLNSNEEFSYIRIRFTDAPNGQWLNVTEVEVYAK